MLKDVEHNSDPQALSGWSGISAYRLITNFISWCKGDLEGFSQELEGQDETLRTRFPSYRVLCKPPPVCFFSGLLLPIWKIIIADMEKWHYKNRDTLCLSFWSKCPPETTDFTHVSISTLHVEQKRKVVGSHKLTDMIRCLTCVEMLLTTKNLIFFSFCFQRFRRFRFMMALKSLNIMWFW